MAYIDWDSRRQTGISCIDKQHQRIVADINDLYEVSLKTDQREVLADVMNEMVDYMAKHFTFEEELLDQAGYEFIKAHERMHFLFLNHLDEYHARFRDGENVMPEIMGMLKTWWENHITNEDTDFVVLVKKKFCSGDPLADEWLSATLKMHFAGGEA